MKTRPLIGRRIRIGCRIHVNQPLLSIVTMKRSENAVSVFHTLLIIQFFERSRVPGFLPTSQISHARDPT